MHQSIPAALRLGNHVCVKARGCPRGWEVPGPRAVQNLLMPRSSPGQAGRSWNSD